MIEASDVEVDDEIAAMVTDDDAADNAADNDANDTAKPYMLRSFSYFTAWNKPELRSEYTYEQLKAITVETLRKLQEGLNEVIYTDDGRVRIHGDIDNDEKDDKKLLIFVDCFIDVLKDLRDDGAGDAAIGGYTKSKALSEAYPLEYNPEGHHMVSFHFSFYQTCISIPLMKKLLSNDNLFFNSKTIDEDGKKTHIYAIGPLENLDGNVYHYTTSKQLMRCVISDKYQYPKQRCYKTATHKVFNVDKEILDDWTTTCVSVKGDERELTESNLIALGLYKPKGGITLSDDEERKALDMLLGNNPNADADTSSTLHFDNPLDQMLYEVMIRIHKDGDKDMELCNKVTAIIGNGLKKSRPLDKVLEIVNRWWNTDKDGKIWEHQDKDYAIRVMKNAYNNANDISAIDIDDEDKMFNSLIQYIEDVEEQEHMKKLYNKLTKKIFMIYDEYHDLEHLKHHTRREIQHMINRTAKLNAVAESTRWFSNASEGYFVTLINQYGYYLCTMDEDKFKKNILKTIFKYEDVNKAEEELKHKCCLDTEKLNIKDLYRYDYLSSIEDKHPETAEQHIKAYKHRLLDGACNNDKQAYKYMLKRQAWIVQHVMTPSQTIDVAVGSQKTGKSFDSEAFGLILDTRPTVNMCEPSEVADVNYEFIQVGAKLSDIVGKFTEQTSKSRFININELDNTDNANENDVHKEYQKLKSTTDVQRSVEGKGKKVMMIQNSLNVNFTSNNLRCIKPDFAETRFFVHQTNSKHDVYDVEYWNSIRSTYSEPYFFKHIYDYLAHKDLEGFNVRQPVITDSYINILKNNSRALDKFVLEHIDSLEDGITKEDFVKLIDNVKKLGGYKDTDRFFDDYVLYYSCTQEHRRYLKSAHSYGVKTYFVMDANKAARVRAVKDRYEDVFGTNDEDDEEYNEDNNEQSISDEINAISTFIDNTKDYVSDLKKEYFITVDAVKDQAKGNKGSITLIEEVLKAYTFVKKKIHDKKDNKRKFTAYVARVGAYDKVDRDSIINIITQIDQGDDDATDES